MNRLPILPINAALRVTGHAALGALAARRHYGRKYAETLMISPTGAPTAARLCAGTALG